MGEEQLKEYWQAYTDAWKLLKNHEKVTAKHISQMISKYNNGIFNRLFCLVVWQEIKRKRSGKNLMKPEQYKNAFSDAWKLFHKFSCPCDSEEYWDNLVNEIRDIAIMYENNVFICNLLVHTTLEEIESIWRRQKTKAHSNLN